MPPRLPSVLLVALLLSGAACRGRSNDDRGSLPAGWERDTVASVNGVTIDRSELQVALVGRAHEAGPAADRERLALEVLVADELAAQRAVQLGLGTAEQPRAQRAAAFRAHIAAAAVTDAEAAVWFA